jgi:hypothetical protein
MKKVILAAFIIAFAIIAAGCGKKAAPIEVQGFDNYKDEAVKFELKYPSNWYVALKRSGARFVCYTNKESMNRFRFQGNYADGPAGAKIEIIPFKLTGPFNADSVFNNFRIFEPSIYSNPENLTIDGTPAVKRNYAFALNDGNFEGEMYIASKDTGFATVIFFESFAGTFKDYKKAAFDEVLKSIKLAITPDLRPDTITIVEEAPLPSATMKSISGMGYTLQIPDNFSSERAKGTKDAISSSMYIGQRRGDCYIAVVVKDATKQKDLKKIVDETVKTIGGASAPSATTLGGQKAFMTSYSQSTKEGSIKTKLYFVHHGDKLYQIAQTWNATKEADVFLPALEKSMASFKFQ